MATSAPVFWALSQAVNNIIPAKIAVSANLVLIRSLLYFLLRVFDIAILQVHRQDDPEFACAIVVEVAKMRSKSTTSIGNNAFISQPANHLEYSSLNWVCRSVIGMA